MKHVPEAVGLSLEHLDLVVDPLEQSGDDGMAEIGQAGALAMAVMQPGLSRTYPDPNPPVRCLSMGHRTL